ncbi:MAG: ABC transporter substrate-binding protein, partial [Alphaproteobacteria bacterium]
NKQLAAAGIGTRVKVDVHESNAKGYDADALDLLKAFAVGKGPDFYVAAHEWVGEFAAAGYAMNMEEHIEAYPEYYADVVPVLWESVKHKGERYAIPQDTEVRMFFYNKNMLRKIGKSEAFIEGLPAKVEGGQFTLWDLSKLAKEVVDKGAARYGIIHRPNVGPDYLMAFLTFGMTFQDPGTGKLRIDKKALEGALEWFAWNVDNGVTPKNNTAMSWDAVNKAWYGEEAFSFMYGVWNIGSHQIRNGWPNNAEGYFEKGGFLLTPVIEKGGKPLTLSHPIVYVVNPDSPHKNLAALLVAIASAPYFNTQHAVGSFHVAISHGQASMPAYKNHWALSAATPFLKYTTFMPNHAKFARYNAILYKGLQGVETGRLTADEAVDFVVDEMNSDLGDDVIIVD